MRNFVIALLLLLGFGATAQTEKGTWMIGGSAKIQRVADDYSFSTGPNNQTIVTGRYGTLALTPTVGYFVADNFMIGLQTGYSRLWTFGSDVKSTAFSIGPVVRYYFPVGKFAFFPELSYQYAIDKSTNLDFDPVSGTYKTTYPKTKKTIFRGGVGAAWFVAPNVGIEGILAYQATDRTKTEVGDQRVFYYSIGIQFYLPAKE